MKTTLSREFAKLKKKFNLPYTSLVIDKTSVNREKAKAVYSPTADTIFVPNNKATPLTLNALLHEMCHAIQNKEDRIYSSSFGGLWKIELEAYKFADKHYDIFYYKKFNYKRPHTDYFEQMAKHYFRYYGKETITIDLLNRLIRFEKTCSVKQRANNFLNKPRNTK